MRIILVTETFPPEVNGVAMTNERLVRGLRERGHQVVVVRPRPRRTAGPSSKPASVNGSEAWVGGMPLPTYPWLQFGLPAQRRLRRLIRDLRPDVIHVATEGPLGWSAVVEARRHRIRLTTSFHTNFHAYCRSYKSGFLEPVVLRYLRWFHNQGVVTLVPSADLIYELSLLGFRNLRLMGRGVDRSLFQPARRSYDLRREWMAQEPHPVILFTSRIAGEKNLPLVLDTFRELRRASPKLRMVVVGDGPMRRRLEREYSEVYFAGMRYGEDLAVHYASADLFLFASITETFGNVIPEAMASGLITLTYDYAAGRHCIRNGVNGFLARLDDAAGFRQSASRILGDRSGWPDIRSAARDATARMPWEPVIDTFETALANGAGQSNTLENEGGRIL